MFVAISLINFLVGQVIFENFPWEISVIFFLTLPTACWLIFLKGLVARPWNTLGWESSRLSLAVCLGTALALLQTASSQQSLLLQESLGDGATLFSFYLSDIREALLVKATHQPQPVSGFVSAVVLGERQAITYSLRQSFRYCGTLHLLVVSGLHVTLVAGIASSLVSLPWRLCYSARFIGFSTWLTCHIFCLFLCCAIVWAFAVFSGYGAPAQRAAVVFCLIKLAPIVFGGLPLGVSLMLAALLHLALFNHQWWNPAILLSWLSYLFFVVLGLQLSTKSISLVRRIWFVFSTQLAASALVVILLGSVSGAGILYNIIITPLFALVLTVSVVWLVAVHFDYYQVTNYSYALLNFFLQLKEKLAIYAERLFFVVEQMSLPMQWTFKLVPLAIVITFLLNACCYLPISHDERNADQNKGV